MLSWTHAIFHGLQDSFAESLHLLPNNTPASLHRGLLNAHQKLSDYYGKSNESPYYTWASCMSCILLWYTTSLTSLLVLDPWISYSGHTHRLWWCFGCPCPPWGHQRTPSCPFLCQVWQTTPNPHSTCSINLCDEQLSSEGWFHISLLKPSSRIYGWGSRVLQAPSWELWHLWSIAVVGWSPFTVP